MQRFGNLLLLSVGLVAFEAAQQNAIAQSAKSALVRRVSVAADAELLPAILERLSTAAKVPIEFASPEVEASANATKITLSLSKVSLQTALNVLMYVADEGARPFLWSVDKKRIVIAAPREFDEFVPGNFDLRGLSAVLADPNHFRLVLMETTTQPWLGVHVDEMGAQIVGLSPTAMQVSHYPDAHVEIADLLNQLKMGVAGRTIRPASDGGPTTLKFLKALGKPAAFSAEQLPLAAAVKEAMTACDASYWFDHTEIGIHNIDINATVTLPAEKQSWREALTAALTQQKLVFYPEYDCIRITTAEYFEADERIRVYDTRKFPGGATADGFIGQLMQQPELSPWMNADDEGGVARGIGPLVIVRQTISKHARIAALLSGK